MLPYQRFTIYYDGSCNTCSREIRFYMRRRGADRLQFLDAAHAAEEELGPGLTREQALARMHVRNEAGHLIEGVDAFIAIWRRLPALRLLGRMADRPGFHHLLRIGYRLFLAWRRRFPSPAQCRVPGARVAQRS